MNKGRIMRAVLAVAVLGVAILIFAGLVATRPEPQRQAPVDGGVLVSTQPAHYETQRFDIEVQGSVRPAREVTVQPQVGGVVVAVAPQLVPGGRLTTGDILFEIDPTDYRLAVDTQRTRLAEAEAQLALEQGRQEVARKEWALFEDQGSDVTDPALALREPQLRAAEAAVNAARAQLRQAQVNLERAIVRAPFNAVVREESVEPGQTVTAQSQAARLVGTDRFWVRAAVPVAKLGFVDPPDNDGAGGSSATIRYDTGSGTVERAGRVVRILSDLDPMGQMARVLIEVEDPLAAEHRRAPLLLDSFVDVTIHSSHAARVVEIPRALLRNGSQVYLFEDGQLNIREVNVAWRREHTVLIDQGLEEGARLVTTNLVTPLAGMKLRAGAPRDRAAMADGLEQ